MHTAAQTRPPVQKGAYAEYEAGEVMEILSDSCEPDPAADGAYRGDQRLLVAIKSGQYAGGNPPDHPCGWSPLRRTSGPRGPYHPADLHL